MNMFNEETWRKEVYRRLREEELQSHLSAYGGAPLVCCNTDHLLAADDFSGRALETLRPYSDEEKQMADGYTASIFKLTKEFVPKQILSPVLTRFGLSPELDAIISAARGIEDLGKINQFIALRPGMEQGQYMFEQCELVGRILHSAVSESASIKEARRILKQRCSRRRQVATHLIESRKFGPRYFGLVKARLHLMPNRQNQVEFSAISHFRSQFLKDWKTRNAFEGVTDYCWFLVPDWHMGASLNFNFFVDIEVNPNLSLLADGLGDHWSKSVTKGNGFLTHDAYFINHMGICPNASCIIDTANVMAMERVRSDLVFQCDRDMYIRFNRADVKECFGHGSVDAGHWGNRRRSEYGRTALLPANSNAYMANSNPAMDSAAMIDSFEVYMGFDSASSTSIYHRPAALQNGNVVVLGPTGSGKTTAIKQYCIGLLKAGIPALVLDPHNQTLEKLPFKTNVVSNGDGAFGINPLRLHFLQWKKRGLDGQIEDKIEMIGQAVGNALGHCERDVLKDALRDLYRRSGLKDEPPSEEWKCPTMELLAEVLEEYLERPDWKSQKKSVVGALAAIRAGFGNRVFNQPSMVQANEFICGKGGRLDLSGLDGDEVGTVMNAILCEVWQACRDMGPVSPTAKIDSERFRIFLVIDEAYLLNKGGKPNAKARILDAIMRGGRKFGICVVLATQGLIDLSDAVRTNTATWISFRQADEAEAGEIARKFAISKEALRSLQNAREAYFWDGLRPIASRIELPCQDEADLDSEAIGSLGATFGYYNVEDISA